MSDQRATPTCLGDLQTALLRESVHAEISKHPGWPDLWNLRGLLHAYEGDFESARADFRKAVALNPTYRRAHWNECWAGLLVDPSQPLPRKLPAAGLCLQPIPLLSVIHDLLQSRSPDRDHDPGDLIFGFALLTVHAARGRTSEVQKTLAALRSKDRRIDDLLEAAGLWSDGGPDEIRIGELGRPEFLNPGLCDLLNHAGHHESMSGHLEEADRLHALGALFEGNRAAYLLERAESLSRARRHDEVLALLKEAADTRPDWFQAHLALGYELSVRGVLERALHHLEKAVSLRPTYPDVLYQYGLLLHAASRNGEAISTMEKALECNPTYLVARIALANLLFEERREAEAAPHYARVVEEGIETPSLAGRFGYSLHAAGSRNHAEELFLEAISQDRERPDLLCLYGMFLSETDRSFEARTVWTRALRCGPSPETRTRIEALLAEAQEVEDDE